MWGSLPEIKMILLYFSLFSLVTTIFRYFYYPPEISVQNDEKNLVKRP